MTKTNLDNFTIGDIRELTKLLSKPHPYIIGRAYFVRTVTMSILGKLEQVYEGELVFSDASWIPNTGTFSEFLKNGFRSQKSCEIEPFHNDCIVSRGGIIDCTIWSHELPTRK